MSSYLPYMFLRRVSKIAWLFYLQRMKYLYMYLQRSLIFLWNIRRSIRGRRYKKISFWVSSIFLHLCIIFSPFKLNNIPWTLFQRKAQTVHWDLLHTSWTCKSRFHIPCGTISHIQSSLFLCSRVPVMFQWKIGLWSKIIHQGMSFFVIDKKL